MHIDIATISEARLADNGCSICPIDDYTIFHSGGVQHMRHGSLTLIAAYAPVDDSIQAEKDYFYHQLGSVVQCSHPHHQLVILGDNSAATGEG